MPRLVLVGIMFFLWAGAPSGGTNHPSASVWWGACLGTLVLVAALAAFGTRMKGASKALLFGSAAGFGYGLQAAVTKTFVGELGHGALSLLADWSVYVLVISAIGFALQQGALKTGVLAPAMASSNAVTLFSSVTLGIIVSGERLSASGGGLSLRRPGPGGGHRRHHAVGFCRGSSRKRGCYRRGLAVSRLYDVTW